MRSKQVLGYQKKHSILLITEKLDYFDQRVVCNTWAQISIAPHYWLLEQLKEQYIPYTVTVFKQSLKRGRPQETCKAMTECKKQMKINNFDKSGLLELLLSTAM